MVMIFVCIAWAFFITTFVILSVQVKVLLGKLARYPTVMQRLVFDNLARKLIIKLLLFVFMLGNSFGLTFIAFVFSK